MIACAVALLAAGLTGCAGPGVVTERKVCKTSSCIYIRQADGSISWEMVTLYAYPYCVRGARWPDCQG